jgi:RsiW-degrading membrane proteinase PrsW (M82 family)
VRPVAFVVALLVIATPIVGFVLLVRAAGRRDRSFRLALATLALGALAFVPAELLERALGWWTGLDKYSRPNDVATLLFTFLVAAPFEQGLKVAAVAPAWRTRHFHEPIDGIVYAGAAALGFVSVNVVVFLWSHTTPLDYLRALIAIPAHVFFAATWGYALGRDKYKRLGGRLFNAAWLLSVLFTGVYDTIVFGRRGPLALLATIPILLSVGLVTVLAGRDLLRIGPTRASVGRVSRFFPALSPPSLGAMRDALRRSERPVMLTWIAFGSLVTTGVMTALVAGAVALGHRAGIDFAAVDRPDAGAAGVAPLVLLGAAALGAFPFAGFLVARASSTGTVLEPAMSAALAIAVVLVLLGLAAPVAVVFAVAFAPIAFALACAGAWVGLTR